MEVHSFIADSAHDAVAQIRERLGANAVVLNVRQIPANGLTRLWQKPRIEVLAHQPEEAASEPAIPETIAELRQELAELRSQMAPGPANPPANALETNRTAFGSTIGDIPTQAAKLLTASGLLPVAVQAILDRIRTENQDALPGTLSETVNYMRFALARSWKACAPVRRNERRPHILVGAPGVGKTTCLCKWLAQTVLIEGLSPTVWRLDTSTANTADFLAVYCEILGVPCERTWGWDPSKPEADLEFIDLPGVDWRSPSAMTGLTRQLEEFKSPRVHLVLNAAYDSSLLLEQVRAFSALPIEDLVISHLDEEIRWGKLWNLVLGTNVSIRFLSAGQNIPGNFEPAQAEKIIARQFPVKQAVSAR